MCYYIRIAPGKLRNSALCRNASRSGRNQKTDRRAPAFQLPPPAPFAEARGRQCETAKTAESEEARPQASLGGTRRWRSRRRRTRAGASGWLHHFGNGAMRLYARSSDTPQITQAEAVGMLEFVAFEDTVGEAPLNLRGSGDCDHHAGRTAGGNAALPPSVAFNGHRSSDGIICQ